jgi:hypothetical protein
MSPTMARHKQQRRQSKDQLANAVRKHFNSMGIIENEVIVDFLYKVRWQGTGSFREHWKHTLTRTRQELPNAIHSSAAAIELFSAFIAASRRRSAQGIYLAYCKDFVYSVIPSWNVVPLFQLFIGLQSQLAWLGMYSAPRRSSQYMWLYLIGCIQDPRAIVMRSVSR